MDSIQSCLCWGVQQLSASDSAQLDTQILLGHCLGMTRTQLYTYPEQAVHAESCAHFKNLIAERLKGIPVAYLVGEQEFWSLPFRVTQDVLIPRADTETLVESVLKLDHDKSLKIVDLGTGSGAIACALAHSCPNWQVFASDVSVKSLEVAQSNVQNLKLNNVTLRQGSWLEPFKGELFDCIASNPPYIDKEDAHLKDLTYEPIGALVAENHGLKDLEDIVMVAGQYLKPNGLLILEHGFEQGKKVRDLMIQAGFTLVETVNDLGGCERATKGCRS